MRGKPPDVSFEEAEVNLTPLIDVLFVILIMFIVVAPLLEMEQISLAPGSSIKSEAFQKQSPIMLHVLSDNSITLNGTPMTLAQLPISLAQAKAHYPNALPQLFQDQKATFGVYQRVKNATELAGFSELNVILKPS